MTATIESGARGYTLRLDEPVPGVGRPRKLCAPARNSDLAGAEAGHQVVVLDCEHDTKPSDPRRGILFIRVRHDPGACTRCAQDAEREREAAFVAALKAALGAVPLGEHMPESARAALSAAWESLDASTIAAHARWWREAMAASSAIEAAEEAAEKARWEASSASRRAQGCDALVCATLAAMSARDAARAALDAAECIELTDDIGPGLRVHWTWTPRTTRAVREKLGATQVHFGGGPDDRHEAGYYDTTDWCSVAGEAPEAPAEWAAECAAAHAAAVEALAAAKERLRLAQEREDAATAAARAAGEAAAQPRRDHADELCDEIARSCPY